MAALLDLAAKHFAGLKLERREARMLAAGEDPLYILRRMVRFASEDVGMADPRALEQVAAAAHTVEHVGMPECALALAQARARLRSGWPRPSTRRCAWSDSQARSG